MTAKKSTGLTVIWSLCQYVELTPLFSMEYFGQKFSPQLCDICDFHYVEKSKLKTSYEPRALTLTKMIVMYSNIHFHNLRIYRNLKLLFQRKYLILLFVSHSDLKVS